MGSPSFPQFAISPGWLAGWQPRNGIQARDELGTPHRVAWRTFTAPRGLQNFMLSFSFSFSDSQWAFSHSVAASIGNAIVALGTLVSRDAQRIKRSVVNHFRQFFLVWRLFHSRSTFQHYLPGGVARHNYNVVWARLVPFLILMPLLPRVSSNYPSCGALYSLTLHQSWSRSWR